MDTSASLNQQMGAQGEALDKLRESMQQLESKITEAKVQIRGWGLGVIGG